LSPQSTSNVTWSLRGRAGDADLRRQVREVG
jgi:hypothetical protein